MTQLPKLYIYIFVMVNCHSNVVRLSFHRFHRIGTGRVGNHNRTYLSKCCKEHPIQYCLAYGPGRGFSDSITDNTAFNSGNDSSSGIIRVRQGKCSVGSAKTEQKLTPEEWVFRGSPVTCDGQYTPVHPTQHFLLSLRDDIQRIAPTSLFCSPRIPSFKSPPAWPCNISTTAPPLLLCDCSRSDHQDFQNEFGKPPFLRPCCNPSLACCTLKFYRSPESRCYRKPCTMR